MPTAYYKLETATPTELKILDAALVRIGLVRLSTDRVVDPKRLIQQLTPRLRAKFRTIAVQRYEEVKPSGRKPRRFMKGLHVIGPHRRD